MRKDKIREKKKEEKGRREENTAERNRTVQKINNRTKA